MNGGGGTVASVGAELHGPSPLSELDEVLCDGLGLNFDGGSGLDFEPGFDLEPGFGFNFDGLGFGFNLEGEFSHELEVDES